MPEARLHITVPEEVWVGELTREYPATRLKILAAMSDGHQGGVGLAEIYSDSVEAVIEDMRQYEAIREVNVFETPDDRALIQFETARPLLLVAAQDAGIPLEMPFEISDGTVTWGVTAPSDRLSELGTQLRTLGLSFTIDYIQQEITGDQLLTDSQDKLIEMALECGYYDTPRTCSLTELADEVDRAKSTVSETLHRAESKIIKQYTNYEKTEPEREPVTLTQ